MVITVNSSIEFEEPKVKQSTLKATLKYDNSISFEENTERAKAKKIEFKDYYDVETSLEEARYDSTTKEEISSKQFRFTGYSKSDYNRQLKMVRDKLQAADKQLATKMKKDMRRQA